MRLLNYLLPVVPLLQTVSSSAPVAIIARPSPANETSVALGDTFTGDAYIDASHADNETWIGNVLFTPSARTHWHTHEKGQLLRVIAGSGWVCDKGASPRHLRVGDTAWCPPGVTHWHGAEEGSFLVHEAIAYGATEWLDAVGDEEYGQADVLTAERITFRNGKLFYRIEQRPTQFMVERGLEHRQLCWCFG